MSTGSVRTKTIECGNSHRRGEVAVGTAAGRTFLNVESEFAANAAGKFEQAADVCGSFHRRAVDPSTHFEARAGHMRLKVSQQNADSLSFLHAGDPYVNFDCGFSR